MFECDLDGLSIAPTEPECRYSLRFSLEQSKLITKEIAQELPQKIGAVTSAGVTIAMLGPDEFLVSSTETRVDAMATALSNISELSFIEISDRDQGFSIRGAHAAVLLAGGCPLNLEIMKAPAATRTLFDRVQVVLFKDSADSYRIYCARSFAPHLEILFAQIATEIKLGV